MLCGSFLPERWPDFIEEEDGSMKKEELKKLIDTAAGRIPADMVIKKLSDRQCFFWQDSEGGYRSFRR